MAARIRKLTLSDSWKKKISAGRIMGRLLGHVEGNVDMSATQVSAARILLSKIVPDLQSTELKVPQSIVHEVRIKIVGT